MDSRGRKDDVNDFSRKVDSVQGRYSSAVTWTAVYRGGPDDVPSSNPVQLPVREKTKVPKKRRGRELTWTCHMTSQPCADRKSSRPPSANFDGLMIRPSVRALDCGAAVFRGNRFDLASSRIGLNLTKLIRFGTKVRYPSDYIKGSPRQR